MEKPVTRWSEYVSTAAGRQELRMEKEPLVCCVCLTRDRPEMLQRAIRCFQAQTYQRKILLILNTGKESLIPDAEHGKYNIWEPCFVGADAMTIGSLRNEAMRWAMSGPTPFPDIVVHFDDDDWSHPARIAEQVALLQASGKEAVGYREMLFWRDESVKEPRTSQIADPSGKFRVIGHHWREVSEAWLFSSGLPKYCLGTSLCYWRTVWEKRPFEDVQKGEDYRWLKGVDSLGTSSMNLPEEHSHPRMIASIHGSNTSPVYKREYLEGSEAQRGEWKRVPQWDDYCRGTMESLHAQA